MLIVTWLLSFIGCGQPTGDKATVFLKRHLTEAERSSIAVASQHALKEHAASSGRIANKK